MQKRLVVHIGIHKTGSTFIQSCLGANRDLLGTVGISYPRLKEKDAHHAVGREFLERPGLGSMPWWRALEEHIQSTDFPTYLISTESLDRAKPESVDLFQSLTEGLGVKVEVVMFIRNQIDCVESSMIATNRLKFYLMSHEERLVNSFRPIRFDYCRFFDMWASRFGSENIRMRVYEQANPILPPFFQAAGCDYLNDLKVPASRLNTRRDARLVFLIRRFAAENCQSLSQNDFFQFLKELDKVTEKIGTGDAVPYGKLTLVDDGFRQKIHDHFERSNRLANEILLPLTEHYFSPKRDLIHVGQADFEYTKRLADRLENHQTDSPLILKWRDFVYQVLRRKNDLS